MGDSEVQSDLDKLLKQKGIEYGESWKLPSYVMQFLNMEDIQQTPYFYVWMQILNKLIRALATPYNKEHWKDISGYAKLVWDDIERRHRDVSSE